MVWRKLLKFGSLSSSPNSYPSKHGTQLSWSCWGCRRQPILAGRCANPETWRCRWPNWFKVASILKQTWIVINDSSMQSTYFLFHIVSMSKNICVFQKTRWTYEWRRDPLVEHLQEWINLHSSTGGQKKWWKNPHLSTALHRSMLFFFFMIVLDKRWSSPVSILSKAKSILIETILSSYISWR